ncbi:hypothetical protein [Umezawaea tangerina]|uniref:hypothetical protein n=1 Tax=Umezawaea tangerina TaxID=84725 RepID=UPI0014745288|nr:hypothetical protein [Umezawaea tangerina]
MDLANRSATIVDTNGRWRGTWSGVSRTTAGDRIATDGWKFTDNSWRMTTDGGTRKVSRWRVPARVRSCAATGGAILALIAGVALGLVERPVPRAITCAVLGISSAAAVVWMWPR